MRFNYKGRDVRDDEIGKKQHSTIGSESGRGHVVPTFYHIQGVRRFRPAGRKSVFGVCEKHEETRLSSTVEHYRS